MNSIMLRKISLPIYTFFIFGWFLSFVISNLISSVIVRFFEIGLISFFLLYVFSYFKVDKRFIYILISLIVCLIMVILKYLFDYHMYYTGEVYFKTIYVLIFTFIIAFSSAGFFLNISLSDKDRLFKILVYYSSISTILLFFLLIFSYGWIPGQSLYFYEIGKHYQGMSRAIGLFFLIIILGKKYLNVFIWISLLLIDLIIIVSFNGGGAVFSVFIGLIFYALIYKISIYKVLIFPIIIFAFFMFLSNSESYIYFSERMMGKLDSDSDLFTRGWLVSKGLELWWGDKYNFIFGAGITNYSCYIDDCMTYWHPHNFFVLLTTWFGVFSIPIILFIIYLTFSKAFFVFFNKCELFLFIFALYLYYLCLALIGGDIEQNRHFIFLIIFIYFVLKSKQYS